MHGDADDADGDADGDTMCDVTCAAKDSWPQFSDVKEEVRWSTFLQWFPHPISFLILQRIQDNNIITIRKSFVSQQWYRGRQNVTAAWIPVVLSDFS